MVTGMLVCCAPRMAATHFQRVQSFHHELPRNLHAQLRLAVEARSDPDRFSCLCTLLESLTTYLDDLCNSIYLARPSAQVDETLEARLRGLDRSLSFGHRAGSLRDFTRIEADIQQKLPELAQVLTAKTLPKECVRAVKSMQVVKEAREEFGIPPVRLLRYVGSRVQADDDKLGRATLDELLRVIVDFRNKGVGHRSEETWFVQDPFFFSLLNGFIEPALDALLAWEPLRAVLTKYEVVEVDPESAGDSEGEPIVRRPELLEGKRPLVTSRMVLQGPLKLEGRYLARRTDEQALLVAVVAYQVFPKTLQSPQLLYQRYRREFLATYLDKGVITPSQRRDELDVWVQKLALSNEKASSDEKRIQHLVDAYSGASDKAGQDSALLELRNELGPEWDNVQERITTLIDQFSTRRKDYIYHTIENAFVMSFGQLRAESELSDPDLARALDALERERKIRVLNAAGSDGGRSHALFKVHDPARPDGFRAILQRLRVTAPPKKKHPELMWQLVTLCGKLLSDEGFTELQDEVQSVRASFETEATGQGPEDENPGEEASSALTLRINDKDVSAPTVRLLLEQVWKEVVAQQIDVSASIPFLIGKTRYFVSSRPTHANGKAFSIPIEFGGYFFEGNLTRAQALNEAIRFLMQSGAKASSPNVEVEYETADESLDDSTTESDERLGIVIPSETGPGEEITGPTVRRFYTRLLSYLLEQGQDLSRIAPVQVGRVRYVLAEEPYHANGRRFQSTISQDGYFMETAYTHAQAVNAAHYICDRLGIYALRLDQQEEGQVDLRVTIGAQSVSGSSVPEFFKASVKALYDEGVLRENDIPYKSGRLRYFISSTPVHEHGRDFTNPIEVSLGGATYYMEANVTRLQALKLIQKLITVGAAPAAEV
jgi:hypothetical protein